MLKKIYFENNVLWIVDRVDEIPTEVKDNLETLWLKTHNNEEVNQAINSLQQGNVKNVVIIHSDIDFILNELRSTFIFIQAAGGFIHCEEDVLLIFRRGKWDLPKGKRDEGETLDEAAIREVEEETGINYVANQAPLCITYHTYYQNKDFILKESHWYFMRVKSKEELTPQNEEGITECRWVNKDKLTEYLKNTHRSIADVITQGLKNWVE